MPEHGWRGEGGKVQLLGCALFEGPRLTRKKLRLRARSNVWLQRKNARATAGLRPQPAGCRVPDLSIETLPSHGPLLSICDSISFYLPLPISGIKSGTSAGVRSGRDHGMARSGVAAAAEGKRRARAEDTQVTGREGPVRGWGAEPRRSACL